MPSILWTGVAFFLYSEMAVALLLCLPIFSPRTWRWLLDSKVFASARPVWKTLFYVVCLILILLFADSVRGMWRSPAVRGGSLDNQLDYHKNMFRAQRNFYITGFALFLIVVIHRLVVMVYHQATLEKSLASIPPREGDKKTK